MHVVLVLPPGFNLRLLGFTRSLIALQVMKDVKDEDKCTCPRN